MMGSEVDFFCVYIQTMLIINKISTEKFNTYKL